MILVYTIILNYNNFKDTQECVESILRQKDDSNIINKMIIVDNASPDDSGKKLKELYAEDLVYIQLDKNIGYAAGNNVGIKYALSQNADFICILNNDTVVETDFISECVDYYSSHKSIGFLSPTIEEYGSNVVQSTGGDIFWKKGEVTVKNNGKDRKTLPKEIESDYLGGACLFFHNSLIEKIGYIPECYFLFFEETEWCWRAKKIGLHNICLSNCYIKHKGSASINSIIGLHSYLMERNRIVFLKRNSFNRLMYYEATAYLTMKYLKKAILVDSNYFKYFKYMDDGRKNIVDLKSYPFIVIRE